MARVSKSTNVCGYVKAERRRRALAARLVVAESRLEPLRRQVTEAGAVSQAKYVKLTGGQIGEARRILDAPEARS